MVLCIGTTPAAQRVMRFDKVCVNQVNRAATTADGAAGKAVNVAKVLQTLGEKPVLTGFLGGLRGQQLAALLKARGIEMDFVIVTAPTRQCITVIDQSSRTVTELVQESLPVDPADYEKLTRLIQRRLKGCRAAIMSGTITPQGPDDFYYRCTQLARDQGVLPVVDAKGPLLVEALKARPALVKPNRSELAATVGSELVEDRDLVEAMRSLAARGAERVVVTDGPKATFAFDGVTVWRVPSPVVEAVNPIGSGDAFTAALVWSLLRGDDLGQASCFASAAGAANALTLMAGELDLAEFQKLARTIQPSRLENF